MAFDPSFNWADDPRDILLDVYDQGGPGTCGMLVPLECISSMKALKDGTAPVRLSTEQLVQNVHLKFPGDCAEIDPHGCVPVNYAWVSFEYVQQEGVGPEKDLKYTGIVKEAAPLMPSTVSKTKINGYVVINSDEPPIYAHGCEFMDKKDVSDDFICKKIRDHPICGEMSWYDAFDNYNEDWGILERPLDAELKGQREYYHAVLIVGYGISVDGGEFYIFKNSKGPRWGKKGFGMVSKDLLHGFSYAKMDGIEVQDPAPNTGPRRSNRLKRDPAPDPALDLAPDTGLRRSERVKRAKHN